MPESTPSLESLVARAADIALSVTLPNAERDDAEARWPAATMEALSAAGLMGLTAPTSVGGLDAGMRGLAATSEELAVASGSAGLCFAMHCGGAAVCAA
ncbi:MAG: acyl-CoA dehydrogenase family protein [Gemmatimonadaceae bacterium]